MTKYRITKEINHFSLSRYWYSIEEFSEIDKTWHYKTGSSIKETAFQHLNFIKENCQNKISLEVIHEEEF